MCNSFSCKLLNGEFAAREKVTTASCFDHLVTISCSETNCIFLIKCDLLDQLRLHHITSSDLKGDEQTIIRSPRDLSKTKEVQYVCAFLLGLHFDLQKNADDNQSIEVVVTDIVSKLRINIGR